MSDGEEFARMLQYAADCILYFQDVSSYNNCHNCGGQKEPFCPYLPKSGELVRINCPLWYPKKEDGE